MLLMAAKMLTLQKSAAEICETVIICYSFYTSFFLNPLSRCNCFDVSHKNYYYNKIVKHIPLFYVDIHFVKKVGYIIIIYNMYT